MSEVTQLLTDSATRLFADGCTKALLDASEQGQYPQTLHDLVTENGFDRVGLSAEGFETRDAFELLKTAGRFAVPLPLTEMILGKRWVGETTSDVSIGLLDGDVVRGVPWGRNCKRVIAVCPESGDLKIGAVQGTEEGANIAGEPRDVVFAAGFEVLSSDDDAYGLLALSRVALMAGCLERALDLAVNYATEREQFGRSISKFQAIQHTLAIVAAEVAAAKRAADAAIDALEGERFTPELAAAKARIGEAVGIVAEAVHQVHGAMGFTHEHELHHYTRRLWAWRDEYGNEVTWQRQLGAHIASLGADEVWDFIATQG